MSISNDDIADDISVYVHRQLRNDRKLKPLDGKAKELVADTLTEKANGM